MSADFFDTNVIVYAFDLQDPAKRQVARQLVDRAIDEDTGAISHQVIQETLSVFSRIGTPVAPPDLSRVLEDVLLPLWRIPPSPELFRRALDVRERYGYHFYDSLIIAAALEAGCDRLLSEDLQHGQQIEGLTIEDPFRA